MKFDLHVHTRRFSMCSTVTPDQVLERARDVSLDGLVLTEHDCFWPEQAMNTLRERYPDLVILNGAEVDVPSLHHVVTILPESDNAVVDPTDPRTFVEDVHDRGGVAIAAHPFRFYDDYDRRNRGHALDGVEIASRNMSDHDSRQRARDLAEDWGAFTVANSDAHSLDPIGQFYNVIDASVSSETDLIEALKTQSFHVEVVES